METTQTLINWHIVLQLGWLTLLGLICHFLDKIDSARKKDGFTWKIFWQQNLISYIIAFILCMVGLAFMGNSIELVSGATKMVIAFGLGFGGGSMVRSLLAKVIQ